MFPTPICYTFSHFLVFYRLNTFYCHFNIFLKIGGFFSFSSNLVTTVTHAFAKQGEPCPAVVHAPVGILCVNDLQACDAKHEKGKGGNM